MTLEDAFLRAIAEAPDDDTPRLVYADWLTDQGDPRGEFIHVQCRLAHLGEDDLRRPELEEREHELLTLHQEAWLGPLCPQLCSWTFRRGFLDRVSFHAEAYIEGAAPVLSPMVRRVEVDLSEFNDPQRAVEYLPESVARENVMLAIGHRHGPLVLAMQETDDVPLLDKLAFILNRDIEPVAAPREQIIDAINRHYQGEVESFVSCILSTG